MPSLMGNFPIFQALKDTASSKKKKKKKMVTPVFVFPLTVSANYTSFKNN